MYEISFSEPKAGITLSVVAKTSSINMRSAIVGIVVSIAIIVSLSIAVSLLYCKRNYKKQEKTIRDFSTLADNKVIAKQNCIESMPLNSGPPISSFSEDIRGSLEEQSTLVEVPQRYTEATLSNYPDYTYSYIVETDTLKLKILQDPHATEECKNRIREDLAKEGIIDIVSHGNKHNIVEERSWEEMTMNSSFSRETMRD